MYVNGMSERLCLGVHLGVIKRGSCMRWYVTIGERVNVCLRPRLEVMLYRGDRLGIPLMMRCVARRCAERAWLGYGLFLVLTGVTELWGLAFGVTFRMVGVGSQTGVSRGRGGWPGGWETSFP